MVMKSSNAMVQMREIDNRCSPDSQAGRPPVSQAVQKESYRLALLASSPPTTPVTQPATIPETCAAFAIDMVAKLSTPMAPVRRTTSEVSIDQTTPGGGRSASSGACFRNSQQGPEGTYSTPDTPPKIPGPPNRYCDRLDTR